MNESILQFLKEQSTELQSEFAAFCSVQNKTSECKVKCKNNKTGYTKTFIWENGVKCIVEAKNVKLDDILCRKITIQKHYRTFSETITKYTMF